MSENMNLEHHYDPIILLRDQLISNLLGEDIDEIMYWAGKELARQQLAQTETEVIQLFDQYAFGSLSLIEEKKNRRLYKLSGQIVQERLQNSELPSFSLESGYLSQQLQELHQVFTEAVYEVKMKKNQVYITIQMDPSESVPFM